MRKKARGEARAEPQDAPITHGICEACSETVLHDSASLASFQLSANEAARRSLGLDLPRLVGALAGEVIERVHAALPGGCGQQLHCAACQIRSSVTATHRTGEALRSIKAYQIVRTPDGEQRLYLRISTEKLQDAVLLRVDEIQRTPGS